MPKLVSLKILPKILMLLSLLAMVSLGATIFATSKMRYIDDTYGDLIDGPGRANLAIARANRNLVYLNRSIFRLITETSAERSQSATKEITDSREFFQKQIKTAIGAMSSKATEIKQIGAKVDGALNGVCAETIRLANSLRAEDKSAAAVHMHEKCDPVLNEVMEEIAKLTNQILKINDQGSEDAQAVTNATIRNTYILILSGLAIVMLVVATLVVRWITRPIRELVADAARLAGGDTTVEFGTAKRGDEIGMVAVAVAGFRDTVITQQKTAERFTREVREKDEHNRSLESVVDAFQLSANQLLATVGENANQMNQTAAALTGIAGDAASQAVAATGASEETAGNVQTVATAAEELSSSIQEIGRQVAQATNAVRAAGAITERSATEIEGLAAAGDRIGAVVGLIQAIAAQTNLLALNATIEAARAGDAGRGFAVVASEVKNLAAETAKATEEIALQVQGIQTSTKSAVEAVKEIATAMRSIDEVTTAIAGAVEQQGNATREISSSVQMASSGTQRLSGNIANVSSAITQANRSADEVRTASGTVSGAAEKLTEEVRKFFVVLRAGPMDRRSEDDPKYTGPQRRAPRTGSAANRAA
jgi:methyl-accepting chemotaxis protein